MIYIHEHTMLHHRIMEVGYKYIAKPCFFRMDPEQIHDVMIRVGERLGQYRIGRVLTKCFFFYRHPMLEQSVDGVHYRNPVGLAAGFDKDARLTKTLPSVGFGAIEVGSITGEACAGNPKPRLWRLPEKESLLVYYGLKNEGAVAIAKRFKKADCVTGVSIAKTNCPETVDTDAAIADYVKAYRKFVHKADYITINISCPNAFGGEPFTDPAKLELLLSAIDNESKPCPIYIKLSPDLSHEQVDEMLGVVANHKIDGFIATNLTKKTPVDNRPSDKGGLSGKVVDKLSTEMVRYLYTKTNGRYTIIGCGGVFTAADAYAKIKAGASLIQLITGMIYRGPQTMAQINCGLVRLLKKDGFTNISDAVGKDHIII